MDIGLKTLGYRRVTWLLLHASPQPNPAREQLLTAIAVSRIVNSIAREPQIQVTCLRRTLTTWWLLRWFSIPSDIRIGINTTGGHAWLEHHGCIVNDYYDVRKGFPIIYSDELAPPNLSKLL